MRAVSRLGHALLRLTKNRNRHQCLELCGIEPVSLVVILLRLVVLLFTVPGIAAAGVIEGVLRIEADGLAVVLERPVATLLVPPAVSACDLLLLVVRI